MRSNSIDTGLTGLHRMGGLFDPQGECPTPVEGDTPVVPMCLTPPGFLCLGLC